MVKLIFFDNLITMRKLIGTIILGVLLSIAQAASAGSFEDGSAHDRGDYSAALKLWRPVG